MMHENVGEGEKNHCGGARINTWAQSLPPRRESVNVVVMGLFRFRQIELGRVTSQKLGKWNRLIWGRFGACFFFHWR